MRKIVIVSIISIIFILSFTSAYSSNPIMPKTNNNNVQCDLKSVVENNRIFEAFNGLYSILNIPSIIWKHRPFIPATYNVYYGSLHNHTNVSDGTGTPGEAYAYAKNIAGLDFFGIADHSDSISESEWTDIKNTAARYNQDGTFVAFYGFEWSHPTYGHVAVINTPDYCDCSNTDTFAKLVKWLSVRDGVAFFNHPGRQNSTGAEFEHFTTAPSSKIVGMELWNKSDGFNNYYYNDGYYTNDGSKSYFDEANSRGWMVGAAGSHDNHSGTWGTDNDYRLAVLAKSKTKASIYDALKNRRFFATLDKNLKLYFDLNGAQMGSVIKAGTYNAVIKAEDGNSELFSNIDLIKNGVVIFTWNPNCSKPVIVKKLTAAKGDYYYIKVKQTDGDEAISSSIYIG